MDTDTVPIINYAVELFALAKKMAVTIPDVQSRYDCFRKHNDEFSRAYPVVFRYMIKDLNFSKTAFVKFLGLLKKDPGKGMKGFIERQADYARLLYLDNHKGKHPNMAKANDIYKFERENMMKWHDKLVKDEQATRNEFEKEEEKNTEEIKKELLNFVINETPEVTPTELNLEEKLEELQKYGVEETETERVDRMSYAELVILIKELQIYEDDLLTALQKKNETIAKLETTVVSKPKPKIVLDLEWIPVEQKKTRRSRRN